MKIVDVNEFYAEQGGGVRTYVNQKLAAAACQGHEMVVIAPGPEDKVEERLGGRVIWVKGPPMPLDPRYFVLYREAEVHRHLQREQPDVIEGSSAWSAGWFAARYPGRGVKTLIYHQDPVAVYPQTFLDRLLPTQLIDGLCFPYWQYVRQLAKRFDATVVAGQWLATRLTQFGVARAEAVPFGIERALFSPGKADAELRAELLRRCGAPPDAALFVSISRHHPEKRLKTLFAAVAELQKERPAALVVFGDGPFRAMMGRAAARVPGVYLAGFEGDRWVIARALASADAMVHGSAAETFGFVIAEAMCAGLPIVAPSRGGAAELVDPTFAETYQPGDARGCAAALSRILRRDRAAMSAASASAASSRVRSTDDHFLALFDLYQRLVEHPSRTAAG